MKYKLYNKIEILDFNVSSQELNYVSKSEKLFFRDKVIIENVSIAGYFLDKCFFFYGDRTGKKVFNTETKKDIYIGHVSPHYQTYNGREIIANEYVDLITYEKKLIVLDLITFSKKTIREGIDFGVRVRYQNQLIINIGKTTLKSLSLTLGTYLWESDLSEYCKILSVSNEPAQGMIRQVLGVWGDKLWVYTDARILLGLSLETGEVLHYISIQETHPDLTNAGFTSAHFEEKNGLVSFMAYRYYMEFDLATLTIHRLKSFDTGNPNTDWNFGVTNTFTEDFVYFTANLGRASYEPYILGVLNRSTLEVEWSINIMTMGDKPIAGGLNQSPQSDGNKIYILDSLGTLHIFEKTEEN